MGSKGGKKGTNELVYKTEVTLVETNLGIPGDGGSENLGDCD